MKLNLKQLFNPFERVAGYRSLLWGIAGMIIATLLSIMADIHYHGLLHFGPAPNPAWWCFAHRASGGMDHSGRFVLYIRAYLF